MLTARAPRASCLTGAHGDRLFAQLHAEPALLLAVSGGPDSVALLVLAVQARARSSDRWPRLVAATVDHRWRAESRAEAEAVRRLCGKLDVPHAILTVSGEVPQTGIEEAGRVARYRLLFGLCRAEGASLVTAHTLDDQAETVLLRLAAGSGPAGLAAMRSLRVSEGVRHFRPFLDLPKASLVAFLDEAEVPSVRDPSNHDPRLARARLRASAGVLAREGLSPHRLSVLAKRMARIDAAVERTVDHAQKDFALVLDADGRGSGALHICGTRLQGLNDEIALRLLARCIAARGGGLPPLAGLERLFSAVTSALRDGDAMARTLAGARVAVAGRDVIVTRAPPRRPPSPGRNPAPC